MLSCSYEQNKIDGKKQIILGPADAQKKDVPGFAFGENEVYGMDVLVTTAEDGKVSLFAPLTNSALMLMTTD
jgi:hypothetical protein